MTEFMGLAEKVSKFNQEALKHLERQTLNPFSGRFSRSPSPRPKFSKEEYGKPAAGSKTELRGQRAFTQISKEILELCEVIHDMGARRRDADGDECIIIPFGELFAFYTKISDKVVGLLIAAKKRGFVYFEPEILFQRRDDDVLIALLKPIEEIRNIINRQISASPSPAATPSDSQKTSPCPTPSPLARQDSNPKLEASSATAEPEKPVPSITTETVAEGEPAPSSSSAEEVPQLSTSNPLPLAPVEEEKVSTDEAENKSDQALAAEALPEVEQTSAAPDTQPATEEKKESTTIEQPQPPVEEKTSPTIAEEVVSTSEPSEPLIPSGDEKIVEDPTVAAEEHDSLSIKILVPVEQVPIEATSEEQSSGQEEQTTALASETPVPVVEETTSSTEQVTPGENEQTTASTEHIAPGDNEQTTASSPIVEETDHTQPPSDKIEEIVPSNEKEQTPPSTDTGEKTLA